MLSNTFIASRARYSTDVATIATTNSTSDTANENFMTDHGSIRFRCSRARRGPRVAAPVMVARADRSVSDTRAAPTAAAPGRVGAPTTEVAPVVWRRPVPVTVVFGAVDGTTVARPVAGVDVVVPGLGEAVVGRPVDDVLGLVLRGGAAATG